MVNIEVQHIPRSYNAIAHSLAKLVLDHYFEIVVWLGSFPTEIMNVFILLNKLKLHFKKKGKI